MANRKTPNGPVTDLTENVNFRMSGPMRAAVRRAAEREDRSEAWIIRRAVARDLLKEHITESLEAAA